MAFTDLTFRSAIESRVAAENAGDRRAMFVTEAGEAISPSAFEAKVAAATAWFAAEGVTAGDRVAIWLPNRLEWMTLLFAAAHVGATVAAVNTRYRTAELQHILGSSGAKMLIFEKRNSYSDFTTFIEELDFTKLPELQQLVVIEADADLPGAIGGVPVGVFAPCPSLPAAPIAGAADSPAMLFTTSGTTNKPKLVLHLQRTLGLHANNCAREIGFEEDDAAFLGAMPFCGVFGISTTLAAIAGGAPVYLNDRFETKLATRTVKAYKITHMFGSDEMFRQIWQTDRTAFAHARICGFASFTPGMETALREMANSGLPLLGLYGASELHAIYSVQSRDLPLDERLKGGGVPTGGKNAHIRVRNTETGELCATGEVGVLEFRSPTNFVGYYRNEEATQKVIDSEGYFFSNDAGYLRPDGSFVYLARNGDFLRLSGFLTDPKEIEEVLEQNATVEKSQVVGIEFEGKTRPVAFVIPADPTKEPDEAAILGVAKASLAHYKVPLRIITLAAFPVTESANGIKIQKTKLRDMAVAALSGK
ncbi:MAG: acyl-CoA synthetase [Alphaproteobacteria bacterium]|nr:MAG: acyl-CoA synthetase [Alphaproteobacteria bacterium]